MLNFRLTFLPLPPFAAESDSHMPTPIFLIAGKVANSGLRVDGQAAFDLDISVQKGLVHNARVRIAAIHWRFIEVCFPGEDERHCIPRISFNFTPAASDWTVIRKQFPLRPAYATTFNGCQGLTLDHTALDVRIDPFAHGQLYTALSRVRRREDTLLLFSESNELQSVANIVYNSLLL
jgi:hypothetical protein